MIQFLHQSATPSELKTPPVDIIPRQQCAFTGEQIRRGYPVKKVITVATSEISDTFRYPSEYVGVQFAELFRAQTLLRGNLLFLEKELRQPMVSSETAEKQKRPCWRNLIHEIEIGTPCVAVITDESKRRLWTQAQLSAFGTHWRPFFNASVVKAGKTFKAPQVSRTLNINVERLRNCLHLVESVQTHGFSKRGIYESLLGESNHVEAVGYRESMQMENALRRWRESDEFLLSVFIAQGKPATTEKKQPKARNAKSKSKSQTQPVSNQLNLFNQ